MQNTFCLRKVFSRLANHDLSKLAATAAHPQSAAIRERVKILAFFEKHGTRITTEAFGLSRATIYAWRRALALAGGALTALAPQSKTPHNKRKRIIHPKIEEFIRDYRIEHPKVGQATIKPHLDAFCARERLHAPSSATLGRIIADLKRKGVLRDSPLHLTVDARTGKIIGGKIKKRRKKLRRKGYSPQVPGDLVQVDSVSIFIDGLKRYIVTAIDLKSRFAFACAYGNLSSMSARDFMDKFRKVAPFEIRHVQTDNGHEFEKFFRSYAEQSGITHFFNYPRTPKSNAYVERFNRTIQEQYVEWNKDKLGDPNEFNTGLMKYLIWYNTEKPHQGLSGGTPMQFVLDSLALTHEKSSMLRYRTRH